jgi:membrane complex biogenesis BtpA family protein
MKSRFRTLFPAEKPLIAMAHLQPLPGSPLYDATAGVQGIVDGVARDLEVLLESGFDGILFANEGDRPYQLRGDLTGAAVMARIVGEVAPDDRPFGVDFLWDSQCSLAIAVATGADFMREVCTGVYESDMGLWHTDAASLLRERRRLDADKLAILMNVTPEFASPIGSRTPALAARSVVTSSLADAILVSGSMAGDEPSLNLVREIRDSVPLEIPVLLNTGAKAATIRDYLEFADGCIVGSDLKVDGHTWNSVDPDRVRRFIDAARSHSVVGRV